MQSETKLFTPLQLKLMIEQRDKTKCVKDTFKSIWSSFWMVIGGIAMAVIGYLLLSLMPDDPKFRKDMALFVWIFYGAGAVLLPFGMILYVLFRMITLPGKLLKAKHAVKCPSCKKFFSMYNSESFYFCTSCGLPLHFSKNSKEISKVACPNCQHFFGIANDISGHRCINCGAELTYNGKSLAVSNNFITCPSCSAAVPEGIFCCPKCDTLSTPLTSLLTDASLDQKLGRGKLGTALNIRALLQNNFEIIRGTLLENFEPYISKPFEVITTAMTTAIESNLFDDGNVTSHLIAIENMIDKNYALTLMKVFLFMSENPEKQYPESVIDKYAYSSSSLSKLRGTFRASIAKLSADNCSSDTSTIVVWSERLFEVEDYTGIKSGAVKNPSKLKEEALRVWPDVAKLINIDKPLNIDKPRNINQDRVVKKTIKSCPNCKAEYCLEDYSYEATKWLCSSCKFELPK